MKTDFAPEPIAIVGVGAIMPDAPDAQAFWANLQSGRYSISDVPGQRWNPDRYYDPDPRAPMKTYSRIGGWVREFPWDPVAWKLPLPPTVVTQLDEGQKWAIATARAALVDAGWPEWEVDPDRVAVIIGNAIGGEKHYWTNLHVEYPEFVESLSAAPAFASLPEAVRSSVLAQTREAFFHGFPGVTEDTMPGELANIIAGRVANIFNFHGANFTTDAACASGLAAANAAVRGLQAHDYDAVVTGGVDRNMGVAAFVKFCKIGALSATGTRPFDAGADGFVMGEGAALFVLKRLSDAERSGDRIYAVLLGVGGSSDGKGKGITAPNPVGQRLAVERAWEDAGVDPRIATYIEAHGTSTRVGDATELASLSEVFAKAGAEPGTIALGSVKSNIGHLKAAAGAAGLFKLTMSLHHKMLAPSLHFDVPNPNVDWAQTPFHVNTELREWPAPPDGAPRTGGVSAFGFGGTNFHLVLEEYQPGRHVAPRAIAMSAKLAQTREFTSAPATQASPNGSSPTSSGPSNVDTSAPDSLAKAPSDHSAAGARTGSIPKAPLRGAAVVGGRDDADLAAQLDRLRAEALAGRAPAGPDPAAIGAPMRVAVDYGDAAELAVKAGKALDALRANNPAIWRMLRAQGVFFGQGPAPKVAFLYTGQGSQYVNMLRGLREREPLVANAFEEADRVMKPFLDQPLSSYVFVDPADVAKAEERLLQTEITQPAVLTADLALTDLLAAYGIRPDMVMGHSLGEYGALVAAGALTFDAALEAVSARGREMAHLQVGDNGAMAAVFGPLAQIERIVSAADGYVVIANINSNSQAVIGGTTAAVEKVIETLQAAGLTARRIPVSHAFHTSIVAPASVPLMETLRRLEIRPPTRPIVSNVTGQFYPADADVPTVLELLGRQVASPVQFVAGLENLYAAGARVFVEVGPKKALHGFVEDVLGATHDDVVALFTNHPKFGDDVAFNQALCGLYAAGLGVPQASALEEPIMTSEPVVITGAALGLPGVPRVFDDQNVARILAGEQFIDTIPHRIRQAMVDHRITRLVKPEEGDPTFETIDREAEVIKLAGRRGEVDVVTDFGVDAARDEALDSSTRLAIGAGFDALRDAGIPLVMHYKTTTLGTRLPDRWGLAESMRDDTGIIFASAFPGYDSFANDLERYFTDRGRREQLATLESVRAHMRDDDSAMTEIDWRISELRRVLATDPYVFDRRFLFRALAMGHSQFAEIIGARGPNTQVNAACTSTAQAICLAEDWIRASRCRRVVIISADDATSDRLLPWIGSGFLASGAAATDDVVEDAATPFDRRRHGMVIGMGAAALVVESASAASERGIQPICEVMAAVTANSAYHGTRLDVDHIGQIMGELVRKAQAHGLDLRASAGETVFVSHETYTPARGGSAAAEINALRSVYGADADRVVITNTKGFTGHAMGAGIEDVLAVKALETGIVPPVPNFKEPDPELGPLNLSEGGTYPIRYALRLAAGFGSQIAMTMLRWTPVADGRHRMPAELGFGYRIADPGAWQRWLETLSGNGETRLEVAQRRLRIVDQNAAAVPTTTTRRIPTSAATPLTTPSPTTARPAPAPIAPSPAAPSPAVVNAMAATAIPAPPVTTRPVALPSSVPTSHVAGLPAAATVGKGQVATAMSTVDKVVDKPMDGSADKAVDKSGEVSQAVVEIVSGLTGYPPELLDPDLDLEADLGVDTVKQAEVFAGVRERFHIPRDETLRLRDFPTLNHVIAWIGDKTAPSTVDEGKDEGKDEVSQAVVEIVSGLTGYPPELLDPDLDLEADLGVDTVKQAEVFAGVRERFHIPRDETLRLRDFPTLNHVIAWIGEKKPQAQVEAQAEAEPEIPVTATIVRRIPVVALRPELSMCASTGVELGAGKRIAIMPDEAGVGDAVRARLRKLGAEVVMLSPELEAETIVEKLGDKPIDGVFWLPALDDEGPLDGLDPAQWREALRRRVGNLYATMRHLYAQQPFLVTGTRLGGFHGYDPAGATCPMGGAVTGFAKAYRKERPDSVVKAVDFPLNRKTAALADLLLDEARRDPGCVEVGYADGRRWGVALAEKPFDTSEGGVHFGPEMVFLVTGAAGSIVSAITSDLANASHGTFHLLDLTPQPDPADADLARFGSDREAFKLDLAARMKERGERPTPVLIDRELARYERLQAALDAVRAIESAGGKAFYHCVDLTDPIAVQTVIGEVRSISPRLDVVLHAAGLEMSHSLPEKEPHEFDLVFGVKANGWHNVMRALGDMPIGAVVSFSSVAGRFGNTGQADYSAANDLLCKLSSGMRRTRPETRAIALDWTAWGGIGMATRGSIPKIMQAAGVEMLPPEIGVPWIRQELTSGGFRGEVVVAGALGQMATELHPTGGLAGSVEAPMIGEAIASVHNGLTVRTRLDPTRQPFLDHHRIDGVPVLPGVMGIEAFVEAAQLLAPGWRVSTVEGVDFLAPLKFYRDEPRTITVTAMIRPDGADLLADCTLAAEQMLPGSEAPQRKVHFTGAVRLVAPGGKPDTAEVPRRGTTTVGPAEVYRLYFHGPAYQVVESAWHDGETAIARFASGLPAQLAPDSGIVVAGPRLIELCFQTAGLWEAGRFGRLALPRHVGTLRFLAEPNESAGAVAVVRPEGDGFGGSIVDSSGRVLLRLDGYRTVALPDPVPADVRAPIQKAMTA